MFKIILLVVSIAARDVLASADDIGIDIIKSGDKCTIFNRKYAEFLYPIIGLDVDFERRNIATWIPGWTDDQCYWRLERESDSVYRIQSLKFDEYLYSLDTGKRTDTRPALTWKPKTTCKRQCYWKLSLVNESTRYFLIENTEYDEYLYASSSYFDDDRRRVYTIKNGSIDVDNDEAAHWAIHCQ